MQLEDRIIVWPIKPGGLGQLRRLGLHKKCSWGANERPFRILDFYALVYVIGGVCRYTFADSPNPEQKIFRGGELFLLFPGVPHYYEPVPGATWDQIYLCFQGPVFDVWRQNGLLDLDRRTFRLQPVNHWQARIEGVAQAFPADDGADPQGICALQTLLADILAQHSGLEVCTDDSRWLHQARAALSAVTRADELDLEAIAAGLNTSYANFRKKFTRLAKTTPGRFHSTTLMRLACKIMQERKVVDRELAEMLGYADTFRFALRFRQIIGVTPRQFRRSLAGSS